MNSDPANNRDSQWDIDRYLLSDPTLDRDAFEQRMLDELSLAELVAASVACLHAISSAARTAAISSAIVSPLTSQNGNHRGAYRWAMLVSAAVLLMAVSVWQFRSTANDDQLSLIADNWVAIENLTTAESLELIATEDQSNEDQSNESQAETEQSDWMVEAAREFYLANNDGAAG
jgi:anti-sigma-K factor RskA